MKFRTLLWRRAWSWSLLLAALTLSAARVQAAPAEAEHAIQIGQTAVELFEAGEYQVALERFRTADLLSHSPVFNLFEARSLDKLGRLLEATRIYEKLVAEKLPSDAPPAWHAALVDGASELSAIKARLPSVELRLSGGTPAELKLDGKPLGMDRAQSELLLDPGTHEFEATSTAHEVIVARVDLREGERKHAVELSLPSESPAPSPATPAPAVRTSAPVVAPRDNPKNPATDPLGIALLAGAGVAAAVGTVTALVAANELSEIRENCDGNQCLKSDASKGETVDTLALVSTVSFVVGGAALAAWGVRIVVSSGENPKSAFAPSAIQLRGTF